MLEMPVVMCNTMVTKVGKGTPRYKIKIARVKISSIYLAGTSVVWSKNIAGEKKSEILTFNFIDLSPVRHFNYVLFTC